MDALHYLHVRIPGRGRVTLSLPGGIERALISGRLPADAEVWQDESERWVPLSHHPEVVKLLELAALPMSLRAAAPDSLPRDLDLFSLPRIPAVLPEPPLPISPVSVDQEKQDPTQLALLVPSGDESRDSSATENRREALRRPSPLPRAPTRVLVAGARELNRNRQRLARLAARYSIPGWAALLALLTLSSGAVAFFFVGRASRGSDVPVALTTTNALSAAWRDQLEPSAEIGVLAEPNPLAMEEQELENNLRTAEAVVWQPAIDFSSRDQLWRSSRKVDAVRNSISLYRIGAWRQIDSAQRDQDPRLEPFDETVRIDEVLRLMQSAVSMLESLVADYRVNGDLLVFSDAAKAEQYAWLKQQADSLLVVPLPGDSLPIPRAPRRIVKRLLETLPSVIVQPDLR